jgi:hypothetical protein
MRDVHATEIRVRVIERVWVPPVVERSSLVLFGIPTPPE